jgi:hypothetical protein
VTESCQCLCTFSLRASKARIFCRLILNAADRWPAAETRHNCRNAARRHPLPHTKSLQIIKPGHRAKPELLQQWPGAHQRHTSAVAPATSSPGCRPMAGCAALIGPFHVPTCAILDESGRDSHTSGGCQRKKAPSGSTEAGIQAETLSHQQGFFCQCLFMNWAGSSQLEE